MDDPDVKTHRTDENLAENPDRAEVSVASVQVSVKTNHLLASRGQVFIANLLVFSRSANDLSTCRRNLAHLANSSCEEVFASSALFWRTCVRSFRCLLAVDERNIREYVENACELAQRAVSSLGYDDRDLRALGGLICPPMKLFE